MYDFFLFGIYARPIADTFFPSDDPYASLMATFLSFAAGFAMRPIGALVLRLLHEPNPRLRLAEAADRSLRWRPERSRDGRADVTPVVQIGSEGRKEQGEWRRNRD